MFLLLTSVAEHSLLGELVLLSHLILPLIHFLSEFARFTLTVALLSRCQN